MELKHFYHKFKVEMPVLLIVPYGIETSLVMIHE